MRLMKGNKVFLEWWNHWMSRIHSTPAPETRGAPTDPTGSAQPRSPDSAQPSSPTALRKTDWTLSQVTPRRQESP